MTTIDDVSVRILQDLLADFRCRKLGTEALSVGYEGPSLDSIKSQFTEEETVDFDLALDELEDKYLVDTRPVPPLDGVPGTGAIIFGVHGMREHVFLTERGYKKALSVTSKSQSRSFPRKPKPDSELVMHFYGIHPVIQQKCGELYEALAFAEAVEKSFKIVRDRLRTLTSYETGSEAFGKGHLHIRGAAATHVDADFNQAVKFLTMAIDMFRNEKSHTSDAKIKDPIRAHQYLSLSSLAMYLLEGADVAS